MSIDGILLLLALPCFVALSVTTTGLRQSMTLGRSGVFLFVTSLFTALCFGAYRLMDEHMLLGAFAKMLGEANYAFLILFIRSLRKPLPRSSEIRGSALVLTVALTHLILNMTLTGLCQAGVMAIQVLVLIAWVALEAWWLWRVQRETTRLLLALVVSAHWLSELAARCTLIWQLGTGEQVLLTPNGTDLAANWMWVTFFLGFMAQLAIAGVVMQALRQDKQKLEAMVQQIEHVLREKENLLRILLTSNAASENHPHLASLAHELRQPLGAIQLNAEYLTSSERLSREEESLVLQNILHENQRAVTIVQSLRSMFMERAPAPSRLNLSSLVRQWVERHTHAISSSRCMPRLEASIHDNLYVCGHAVHLEMLLHNLVTNAVQAMAHDPHGTVSIRLTPHERQVILEVSDTGPGVPQAMTEKIFEMNYSTKTEGMGLGLWLSRRIAQLHGGVLVCLPQPSGARMRLTLPLEAA